MNVCHKCGAEWDGEGKPPFHEECPQCQAFLHCCLNCRLHDPSAHNQCRSSTTEPVVYKDRDNYCEEFDFIEGERQTDDRSGQAKSDWEHLFGGD